MPFSDEGVGYGISRIIANDLLQSGVFKPIAITHLPENPNNINEVEFLKWKSYADSLIVGHVTKIYETTTIQIELISVYKKVRLVKYKYSFSEEQLNNSMFVRKVAHKFSDMIFKKLTGLRGIFTTKLAYVSVTKTKKGRVYSLDISGVDGLDTQSVFKSRKSIMSPSWTPDGNSITFVSFENDKAEIWQINLLNRKRRKIFSFRGNASSPSWSASGDKLAVTLVRKGNSDIYVLDLKAKKFYRFTKHKSVDTEATWSPDEKYIYFLSNRNGQPQIYRKSFENNKVGAIKKITAKGSYNTSPDVSIDNKYLAFLHRKKGKYKVALQDLSSGKLRIISNTNFDEAPSFSPNGQMLVYASKTKQGLGVIAITNILGKGHQIYSSNIKDVREPAWSPFLY